MRDLDGCANPCCADLGIVTWGGVILAMVIEMLVVRRRATFNRIFGLYPVSRICYDDVYNAPLLFVTQ